MRGGGRGGGPLSGQPDLTCVCVPLGSVFQHYDLTCVCSPGFCVPLGSVFPWVLCSSIMDAREFEWESQLRFYWDREPDDLFVRQCSASFSYGYEYMGLNGQIGRASCRERV